MKRLLPVLLTMLGAAAALLCSSKCAVGSPLPAAKDKNDEFSADEVKAFAALEPIDTHTHVFKNDPGLYALLKRLNLHILDIVVFNDHDGHYSELLPKLSDALAIVRRSQGYAAFCSTFDPYKFADPGFGAQSIKQLNQSFAEGAVAVKIWKNIGMELKNSQGKYVMPDDAVFAPIYKDIADHNKTLIAHLAEPTSCWRSPDPESPDYEYYKEHPEWYMYLHPDHPSKETILAARDRLLEENPKLRVVGAHLGSMEADLDDIARHFDSYPNFSVDSAARVPYLMLQPRAKVRAFLIKYQDRVLYATDLNIYSGPETDDFKEWKDTYARDWRFFATDTTLEYRGQKVRGLKLPESVLRKLYHDNATRWIPGIAP